MRLRDCVFYLMFGLCVAFSCPPTGKLHVVNGSMVDRMEFALDGQTSRLQGFTVTACGVVRHSLGARKWGIVIKDSTSLPPNRIRYGQVPIGWAEYFPVTKLLPGCYEADTWGLKSAVLFVVDSSGVVREASDSLVLP
jgi:hypothetical protein